MISDLKIGKKPFESMAHFKYLGTNAKIKITFMEKLRSD
jgi:hypothetical protein